MKRAKDAILELEQRLSQLERELRRHPVRPERRPPDRDGWWLGVLTTDLPPQGTGTFRIIIRDPDAGTWVYKTKTIEITDFWLNSDDPAIQQGTRIKPVWYRNVWTYDQAYCKVANNLPSD
jgi:hypothetical protein